MTDSIHVQNLVKKYRQAKENAVDGISFTVKSGQFFSFLGPNGAGKTTTISILNTTLSKTSGQVVVTGHDLDIDPAGIRQNIGVIFQNPSFDTNLTAEENIRLHALMYGLYPFRPAYSMMPVEYKNRVAELTGMLGLQDQIFQPVKTLSGGMKRKLEIVRSLLHNPQVLFLDEPTAGLDAISRKNLWQYLKDIRQKQNITILLTTHYLEEAEDSDKVCIINHGKIIMEGRPQDIKARLLSQYLLVSAANQKKLLAELDHKKIRYSLNGRVKIDLRGKSIHPLLKSITTPLTFVDIHNPTLEEAYVDVIENHLKV